MARKNKSPPLSYSEKYRQIKQSGFNVDVPRPTDSYGKSLVTRYHRTLFGGSVVRHGKRVHTFGLAKSYAVSKSTNPNTISALKNQYRISGTPRIKNAYFPREFKAISKVTKNFLTFKTQTGTYKVLRVTPKQLREAAANGRNSVENLLKPLRKRNRIQIISGAHMRPQFFDYDSLVDELMDIEEESEEALAIIRVGTFTFGG